MNHERPIVTAQDVERYRHEARLMQSRETARLVRRLFGAPARLLGRLRGARADGTATGRARTA